MSRAKQTEDGMKISKGFTLLELVVVVAIAGILAAVVIPALLSGRVAANESATLGDIRTIMSAQATYRAVNSGFYDGELSCLVAPSFAGCVPSYPTNAPTFLDSTLASQNAKTGYSRSFSHGPYANPTPPTASPTSVLVYRYDATPVIAGLTGIRGFAGDDAGRICVTADGAPVPSGTPGTLPANCQDVR
jgi:prepilin-type N-terminal cleavage/methylation domain-containing protein